MKYRLMGTFEYSPTKKFKQYIDSNDKMYIQKNANLESYQLLRAISDIAKVSDNLLEISAFYKTEDNKLSYLVPLVEGKTLERVIQSGVQMNQETIDNIIYQLCSGLKELHKVDILHRDIKPGNIIIDKKGIVKLFDYDISRQIKAGKSEDTDKSGTHGYAAPEQYGFHQTNPSTDIYALGKTIERLVDRCAPNFSYQYAELIKKATEFEHIKRYQTVDEIIKVITQKQTRFFPGQLEQIEKAKDLGLTNDEIKLIAHSRYNSKQMGVLKHAINENVDDVIFNLMADHEFNSQQMWQIKAGWKNGLTTSEIQQYAKPYYSANEMIIQRLGIKQKQSREEINTMMREFNNLLNDNQFSDEQISKLRLGLHLNLGITKVKVYAHEFLTIEQMDAIINILKLEKQ